MVLDENSFLEEVYAHARRAYGDLADPDYGFYGQALKGKPWSSLVKQFFTFADVEDISDHADGVCFRCTISERKRWRWSRSTEPVWSLWLSAVGPYAMLAETPASEPEVRRVDVIASQNDTEHPWGRRIVQILQDGGITLLNAQEVETTVRFKAWDSRFPVSLFVMLFELDDVPWWHNW